MKAIVVDNSNSLFHDKSNHFETNYNKSPREIAEQLYLCYKNQMTKEACFEGEIAKKDSLHIFINIEGLFGVNCKRQEQKGVEILMWLRCKYQVCNPIVLYSFQSVSQLLKREPKNLIITSDGCYHFQLPFDFSKLKDKTFNGISDCDNLKKYLKPAFDISQFRHAHANWWGVKCLWDVHSILNPESIKDYPKSIKDRFETLDGILAQFLYGLKEGQLHYEIEKIHNKYQKFNDEISKLLLNLKEQSEYINSEISNYSGNIENLNKRKLATSAILSNIEELIKKDEYQILENSPGFPDFINNIKISLTNFDKSIDDCIETIKYFENEESKVEDKESKVLFEKADLPSKMEKELSNVIDLQKLTNTYSPILKKINVDTNDLKILYIDDMGHQGWSEIFQKMIYSYEDAQRFQTLIPNEFLSDYDVLFNKIRTFKPNCILLDLRLKGETGVISDFASLSGAECLDKIHSRFPEIPVVMVTASNKAYSLRGLKELGAFEMWSKEGIDDEMTVVKTLNNYFNLLRFIHSAISLFEDEFFKLKYLLEIELSKIENLEDLNTFKNIKPTNTNYTIYDLNSGKYIDTESLNTFQLQQYDYCITDTNIWIDKGNYIRNQAGLYLLARIYKEKSISSNTGFVVFNRVYTEIFYHSILESTKQNNDPYLRERAEYSLLKINSFLKSGYCITDKSVKKEIKSSFNLYADDLLIEYIINLLKFGKSVLFISEDKELKEHLALIVNKNSEPNYVLYDKILSKIKKLKIEDSKKDYFKTLVDELDKKSEVKDLLDQYWLYSEPLKILNIFYTFSFQTPLISYNDLVQLKSIFSEIYDNQQLIFSQRQKYYNKKIVLNVSDLCFTSSDIFNNILIYP